MHEVLVNCLGGLSLPRKNVVRLTDRPDMTLDVYSGRKTTIQQQLVLKVNGCIFWGSNSFIFIFASHLMRGQLLKEFASPGANFSPRINPILGRFCPPGKRTESLKNCLSLKT